MTGRLQSTLNFSDIQGNMGMQKIIELIPIIPKLNIMPIGFRFVMLGHV